MSFSFARMSASSASILLFAFSRSAIFLALVAGTAASAVVTASIRSVSSCLESPSVKTFFAALASAFACCRALDTLRPSGLVSLSVGASGSRFGGGRRPRLFFGALRVRQAPITVSNKAGP